jgi:hypothetical protein
VRSLFANLRRLTLPAGATVGVRIELDGITGEIRFYDETNAFVGLLSPDQWAIGDLDTPGTRITLDPTGGLRIRNEADVLASILDQQGYTLRDTSTGLVVAEIRAGSIRLVDPSGTDDIELTTTSAGSMPSPSFTQLKEATPGATVGVPATGVFTSTPADDLSIGHVAAWLRNTVQASTWTPPGGWTERLDDDTSPDDSTLAVSVATLAATTGAAGVFTNTETNWQHGLGSHVVVRGGGTVSPSFQTESHTGTEFFTGTSHSMSLAPPGGVLDGRILVAFVALGNDGGGVPTGWKAPDGWVFLGADFMFTGSGSTLSVLAVGVWAKLGTASEPATYDVSLNIGAGRKTMHACIIAVADPFLIDGGANIRIAGHPIRRLLAFNELQADSATLCNFTNIPQGYDHLEVVYTGKSDRGTDARRNLSTRFNGDTGANYHMQVNRDNVLSQILNTTRIMVGSINGASAGHECGGRFNIYDYTHTGERRMLLGDSFYLEVGQLVEETDRGLWLNTADPITSLDLIVEVGPTMFETGSRAYLYGY